MTKEGTREVIKVEKAFGGEGYILKEPLLRGEELGEHCKMYAKVTIPAGCELGYHTHIGETETYYLLSGEGIYRDNDLELPAKAGDVFHCKDGNGHGLKNTGDTDIVFMALILLK